MNKIAIIIQGGMIQAVHSMEDIDITIIDKDEHSDKLIHWNPDTIGLVDTIIDEELK